MDRNQFSRFEKRVQALVEGGFARLFAARLKPREVALALARAMEDNAHIDDDARLAAPNRYVVRLHPEDHQALLAAQPDLAGTLARHLIDLARESDLQLDTPPEVKLVAAERIAPHAVEVTARYEAASRQSTQAMSPVTRSAGVPAGEGQGAAGPPGKLPPAFLVVDGSRYVPLDRSTITIGRRRDNAIVVDDARVSRRHCQLRFRFGHFVLYDLGSRGGTFVNNSRVNEYVLRPGDVISLAGVLMVYVVDEPTEEGRAASGGGDTNLLRREDLSGTGGRPDRIPEDMSEDGDGGR